MDAFRASGLGTRRAPRPHTQARRDGSAGQAYPIGWVKGNRQMFRRVDPLRRAIPRDRLGLRHVGPPNASGVRRDRDVAVGRRLPEVEAALPLPPSGRGWGARIARRQQERGQAPADRPNRPAHGRRGGGTERRVLDLDPDQGNVAGELGDKVAGQHRGGERARGGIEPGSFLPVEPADGPRGVNQVASACLAVPLVPV